MRLAGVPDLAHPADDGELMDAPDASWTDMEDAFEDLALSNRWLGGVGPAIAECGDLLRVAARDGRAPAVLLDVGGGGGDVALALARWARAAGIDVEVVIVDLSPHAVRFAARACAGAARVHVVRGDAFMPPFAAGTVDVVHAGLFMHHVPRHEQPAMLARLASLARAGGVVSDLRRTAWAHAGVRAFAALTRRRRLFRHDGPVSVARGFTLAEARAIAVASGVPGVRVRRHPFSRLTWSWTR